MNEQTPTEVQLHGQRMQDDQKPPCPLCNDICSVRPKMLMIGKASPRLLLPDFEERGGFRRKDQLAVDECKPEALLDAPLQQFVSGFYCDKCGRGFVPDSMLLSG